MKKFISIIVILSLLYSNCAFSLTKPSEFQSAGFRSSIKPLALISSLYEKKEVNIQDLLLIKAVLIQFFRWEGIDAITLVYNKANRELFIYNEEEIVHIWRYGKTNLHEKAIQHENIGGINIARYKFKKGLEETIAKIDNKTTMDKEEKIPAPPTPKRLQSSLYLKLRFWLGLGFLSFAMPVCLAIYGVYSIFEGLTDAVQKRLLDTEGYERWLERRRHWLLNIAVPLLKIFPLLRIELRDILLKSPPHIFAQDEVYSSKRIPEERILYEIRQRYKVTPKGKEWEEAKGKLKAILEELGETDLLQALDKTPFYLVGPGDDINSPFIYHDKKKNSYLFTYVTGEPQQNLSFTGRFRRFINTGQVEYLKSAEPFIKGTSAIYISQVFFEQISKQKPLISMLLAEIISQLPNTSHDIPKKIIQKIEKQGLTLDEAKTVIKNAYFFREREPSPAEWSKGILRGKIRSAILKFITWSQKFYGWAHFMKSFISEFFTITQNWVRTPFIYPLRRNLHCGIPTPDMPLPEYGTYLWAIQLGFSDEAARIMGEADICTDKITSGYIPRIGDQSRHYNMYLHDKRWQELRKKVSSDITQIEAFYNGLEVDKSIRDNYDPNPQFKTDTDIELPENKNWSEVNHPDTRLDWAQYELERGEYYFNIGEKRLALECIGRGLHSLQDLVAHRDFEVGPFGTKIHPPELDDPNYDPDTTGQLVPSTERHRIKETERLTKIYLELAIKRFQRRYYPRLEYFEIEKEGIDTRYYMNGLKKGVIETRLEKNWIRKNACFAYTKIKFKNGLHTRPATNIAYVARILHALTGINTTISKVDIHPFPGAPANASSPMEELTLVAPFGTEIMVTVEGDIQREFLNKALDIIINEVFEIEIFNDIGIEPKDEEEDERPDLFYNALHVRERILYLINNLALEIKKAEDDKRPLSEEAQAQKTLIDTFININTALAQSIIDDSERNKIAHYVYFLIRRLNEIREEISTRAIRPLSSTVPEEPNNLLPLYTEEFFEYAVLTGLIPDPLKWYEKLSKLRDDFKLSALRLQSFKVWLQIVEFVKNENPGLSVTRLKEKIVDCYYRTYGEIAARKLGSVYLTMDLLASGINIFPQLRDELASILAKSDFPGLHSFINNENKQMLTATRIVGLGLLTEGGLPPELRKLLLGEEQQDLIARLGVGESIESLGEKFPDRFRTANSWHDIYEYIQTLIAMGIKPQRILVDLDITVFTPIGYIGSYPWFDQKIREIGRHRTFWEWGDHERRMEQHGFFNLVDPEIPQIIEKLKRQGIEVIGFTARMWKKDSRRTNRILSKLGIKFSRIPFVPGIYQYGGVVYTFGQGAYKSKAFERLARGRNSEVTVVIDDALPNIANILRNTKPVQPYGVLYKSPAPGKLLSLKLLDYIKLGDTALSQGQFDFAEEYFINAVEQIRYLNPQERPSAIREIWKRVVILNSLGRDTEGLVRFLTGYDDSKEDLRIMDNRLKDPYLDFLVKKPPITNLETLKVLVYEVTESTDINNLKNILRTIRFIRNNDGNPKFRTVVTSKMPAYEIRQRLKKLGLEDGIDYDFWIIPKIGETILDVLHRRDKELKYLTKTNIINISSNTYQSTYEAIAESEGYNKGIPHLIDISTFSHLKLQALREDAKRKIESLHRDSIKITLTPDINGIATALAETIFLKKYFGQDLEITYIISEKTGASCLETTILNSEVLRQTKGLTSAGLYLEETSWLVALFIYGNNLEAEWSQYLPSYSLDKVELDKLAELINISLQSPEAIGFILSTLLSSETPTSEEKVKKIKAQIISGPSPQTLKIRLEEPALLSSS